jgi:peroxiredoxin Q/BCP
MMALLVGDLAPDFTATAHTGQQVSLAEFRGRKVVVLYFYPKDGSAACTREACGFRDAYQDFAEAGAVVIGVSSDSVGSHEAFASGHRLPFVLVSDEGGGLRRAYRVSRMLGVLPGRVTYVIDKQGVIRHLFKSQLAADRHVAEALSVVNQLART